MNPIRQYKTYFAYLAAQHTALRTTTVGGGTFGIEQLSEIIEGTFRSRTGDNTYAFVLLNPILHPQTSGDGFDGVLEGGFLVMKGGLGRDSSETDIINAYTDCFSVATDFLIRMENDSRNGHSFFNHGFDAISQGNVDMEEIAFNHAVDGTFAALKVVLSFIVPFSDCATAASSLSPQKWIDKT